MVSGAGASETPLPQITIYDPHEYVEVDQSRPNEQDRIERKQSCGNNRSDQSPPVVNRRPALKTYTLIFAEFGLAGSCLLSGEELDAKVSVFPLSGVCA